MPIAMQCRCSRGRSLTTTAAALLTILAGGCASLTGSRATTPSRVQFVVRIADPADRSFDVDVSIPDLHADTVVYRLPAWAPGAYQIVNYGSYVQDFIATTPTGRRLQARRVDSNSFEILGVESGLHLDYRVDAIGARPERMWVEGSDVDSNYAYANGTALFGYIQGATDAQQTVRFQVPNDWSVAVGLDTLSTTPDTYVAADYDELADTPVLTGRVEQLPFTVDGRPHLLAICAPARLGDSDRAQLLRTTDSVVRTISHFFGAMPYRRYVFQIVLADRTWSQQHGPTGFGALEHRRSSTYLMPDRPGGLAAELGSVIAHEYWHVWNPKRIRPSQLEHIDYQNTPKMSALWFVEGVTEYYAHLEMRRAGLEGPSSFLDGLESAVNTWSDASRQEHSLAELSRRISTLPLRSAYDLYTTGPLVGLMLDLEIRRQTDNRHSLDDAMHALDRQFGGSDTGYVDGDLIGIIGRATGTDLDEFYRRFIDGTEPLPVQRYVPLLGLRCEFEAYESWTPGASLSEQSTGWRVDSVEAHGAFDSMGVRVGDEIVAVEFLGQRQDVAGLPVAMASDMIGGMAAEGVTVILLRGGQEVSLPAVDTRSTIEICHLRPDPDASEEALAIQREILGRRLAADSTFGTVTDPFGRTAPSMAPSSGSAASTHDVDAKP